MRPNTWLLCVAVSTLAVSASVQSRQSAGGDTSPLWTFKAGG